MKRIEKVEEREIPAIIKVVRLFCKCGTEMKATGRGFPTEPPKYEYLCPVCKYRQVTEKQYPHLKYDEQPI